MLALLYAGDPEQGEPLIKPLRKFGTPVGEHVGVQPLHRLAAGLRPAAHCRRTQLLEVPQFLDARRRALRRRHRYIGKLPSPQCEIFFGALGGATTRPAPDSAAYPHRDAMFVMNSTADGKTPADDERCIAWARDFFKASAPFASGGVYVNFLTADEADRVRAAYGPNYDRLAQVKRKYDPENLFRMNQNIRPA